MAFLCQKLTLLLLFLASVLATLPYQTSKPYTDAHRIELLNRAYLGKIRSSSDALNSLPFTHESPKSDHRILRKRDDLAQQSARSLDQNTICSSSADCGDFGKCSSGGCICNEGHFGTTCSISAAILYDYSLSVSQVVPANGFAYFYYAIPNEISYNSISFGLDFEYGEASYTTDPVLNSPQTSYSYTPMNTSSLTMMVETLQTLQNHAILFEFYNLYPTQSQMIQIGVITYSDEKDNKNVLFVILIACAIAIVGPMIVCFPCWSVIYCYYRSKRKNEIARRAAANIMANNQELLFLKHFPPTQFRNLTSGFSQNSCSICSEDFAAIDTCRQLYCEHVFHIQCIESSLKQDKKCPVCKKEITEDAINAHFTSQAIRNQDAEAANLAGRMSEKEEMKEQPVVPNEEGQESRIEIDFPGYVAQISSVDEKRDKLITQEFCKADKQDISLS